MTRSYCQLSNPRHANTALLVRLFGLSPLKPENQALSHSVFPPQLIYLKYLNIHFYERVHRAGHEILPSRKKEIPKDIFLISSSHSRIKPSNQYLRFYFNPRGSIAGASMLQCNPFVAAPRGQYNLHVPTSNNSIT